MPFELLEEEAPASSSFELIDEPEVAATPTTLETLAPLTAASVGELRRREGAGEIAARKPILQSLGEALAATQPSPVGSSIFTPTSPEDRAAYGQAAADVTRYGVPAAAAVASAPVSVPAALTLGAITGGSEMAAQLMEKGAGTREETSPGAVVGQTVLGATPFAGPAKSLAGPVVAGLKTAVQQAFINQGTFAFSRVLENAINQGRMPTMDEISEGMTDLKNYLPAVIGFGAGGLQGTLSQPAKALTTEQAIAAEGAAARTSLEAATGRPAPLTGTQQTGRQIPGEFTPASGEIAAQQAVPENVRAALGVTPDAAPSLAAEQQIVRAGDRAAARLEGQVAGTAGQASGEVEATLQTMLPGTARGASVQDAAQKTIGGVRGVAQKLKDDVDVAFGDARAKAQAASAGKPPEALMERPRAAGKEAEKVLDTLAVKEVINEDGSVTRIPAQFFDEATRIARGIMEVADSPQTLEQITGLRQAVGELMDQGTQIAPGFGRKQLAGLYKALEIDEANAAAKYGPEVNEAFKAARAVAKRRFDTLESNPVILRILKDPSEAGAFQNPEQLYDVMARQPEALDSLRKMLPPAEMQQVRRGLFDSLRSPDPVNVGGVPHENATSLAKNFRALPQSARTEIAGNEKLAAELQSILDDAARVQAAGSGIPTTGGIEEATLNRLVSEAGKINSATLRKAVMADVNKARQNARTYYNDTTKRVRERTLNPDIEPDRFVRDFVLQSSDVGVVKQALGMLKPSTRAEVRKQAARVFLDTAIEKAQTAKGIEGLVEDAGRKAIVREILDPADYELVENFIKWSRARNLTASAEPLRPDNLSRFVWKNTKARFVIDSLVGSAQMQDFLASVARGPSWLAKVKPAMTVDEATALANAVKIPLNTMVAEWARYADESKAASASIPAAQRPAFEESLGVPEAPQ